MRCARSAATGRKAKDPGTDAGESRSDGAYLTSVGLMFTMWMENPPPDGVRSLRSSCSTFCLASFLSFARTAHVTEAVASTWNALFTKLSPPAGGCDSLGPKRFRSWPSSESGFLYHRRSHKRSNSQPSVMSQQETRRSLLQYYSSGTTAHATHLLTFALIGAALLASAPVLHRCALVIILSLIAAVSVWTGLRILYWGSLANGIIHLTPGKNGSMGDMHNKAYEDGRNSRSRLRRYLFRLGENNLIWTALLLVVCFFVASVALFCGHILT
jgi:hypothetical protein